MKLKADPLKRNKIDKPSARLTEGKKRNENEIRMKEGTLQVITHKSVHSYEQFYAIKLA